jgi:hypothetical protein
MKMLRALLTVVLVSVAARALAAPFEGKIELLSTEGKKSFTTTFYYKGDKMRVESSEAKDTGAMVMDMAAKEMLILMPSEKMYMVMKFGGQMEEKTTDTTTAPVKTGRTETILGYECHEYTVTENKKVTEYWAAKGLGVFRSMARGGPGRPPAGLSPWEAEAMREGLFPLRTIERSVKGKEISRSEATAIEPGSLSASLFAPPKDFAKFEMPSMFGR